MPISPTNSNSGDQQALRIYERYCQPYAFEKGFSTTNILRSQTLDDHSVGIDGTAIRSLQATGDELDDILLLRWFAVLLDHPLVHPHWHEPASFMVAKSQAIGRGVPAGSGGWAAYAHHWHALGFSPELYALLHKTVALAVSTTKADSKRLIALQLDGRLGYRGNRNLDPGDWAELPSLLKRMRPSQAVKIVIRGESEVRG